MKTSCRKRPKKKNLTKLRKKNLTKLRKKI